MKINKHILQSTIKAGRDINRTTLCSDWDSVFQKKGVLCQGKLIVNDPILWNVRGDMKDFLLLCRIFIKESICKRCPTCCRTAPPAVFLVCKSTEWIVLCCAPHTTLMPTRVIQFVPSTLGLCEFTLGLGCAVEHSRSQSDPGVGSG